MAANGRVGTDEETRQALRNAVGAALHAPSILNTQPWRWRLCGATLELRLDVRRQLHSIDAQGRLATISCGAALHHADVFLSAYGYRVTVERLPDAGAPTLLARLRIAACADVDHHDQEMARAIRHRRSDRRPIAGGVPMHDTDVAALICAATARGASVHRVTGGQRRVLTDAADRAHSVEEADETYLRELRAWTVERPRDAGVSFACLVAPVDRPVALRDFADGGETGLHPGFGDDRIADYLILSTVGDQSPDWLRAGEATSAIWLTATANKLAMSVLSDVVEVADARALLASLLDEPGYPQLVLRTGPQCQPTPPPASSRRALADVLDEDPPTAD